MSSSSTGTYGSQYGTETSNPALPRPLGACEPAQSEELKPEKEGKDHEVNTRLQRKR